MGTCQHMLFITGLGDTASAYDSARALLQQELCDKAVSTELVTLGSLSDLNHFSIDEAADGIAQLVRGRELCTHVVGVSAGAMVALRYAAHHDVASLCLVAPQMRPSRWLVGAQNLVFRLMPASFFESAELTKQHMISVAGHLGSVDLTDDARHIACPTTIVCGSKDRFNIKAAHHVSQLIDHSRLVIVPGAKHEWHTQSPEQFAGIVRNHFSF